jgi:hypothetical protein
MGWGFWAGPFGFGNNERAYTVEQNTRGFGDDAPLFTWLMVDWHWAGLEPQEGEFNWRDFDAVISYWTERNKQIVLRFWFTDDPGWNGAPGRPICPDWIWAKGMKYREYVGEGKVKQRQPDYNDPTFHTIFLPGIQKFLNIFASRYDKPDTSIIFIQAQGYGHWADNATWYSKYEFPNKQVKHDLLAGIVNLYADTFKYIRPFQFAGADWDAFRLKSLEEHLYAKALDIAIQRDYGLIWTGFIDGLGGWDRDLMLKYWRTNPIIAEGDWNYDDMKDHRTHGTLEENLEVMLEWHANFAHFYQVMDSYQRAMQEDRPFFEKGLQSGGLGYRFIPAILAWPADLAAGQLMVFRQTWVNRNVGRLYVRHPLKLYLTDQEGNEKFSESDSSFNPIQWVQGETYSLNSVFHLPKTLLPGTYDVRIALVDNGGKARINLAVEGKDALNRYRVGNIRILHGLQ